MQSAKDVYKRQHLEYYNNYQRYQLMQVDKERVIMACNIIINDLIGRLYRYEMCIRDRGYTVLLCFTLFKTGSLAKSVFQAH